MRRIHLLSGILWCLILTLACTSQNSDSPEIHFITPESNAFHDLNKDFKVEIDISDDKLISEYEFWLESDFGFEYFFEKKKVNEISYKILYRFDLSTNIHNDFSIHLEVKDNEGNKTYDTMDIAIH